MKSALSHIQLELAPEPEHPFGDRDYAYHLYLPLAPDGRVDAETLQKAQPKCRVRRLRPGQEEARGRIELGPAGQLILEYEGDAQVREIGFRWARSRFAVGQAVPIAEENGTAHLFHVIAVRREQMV